MRVRMSRLDEDSGIALITVIAMGFVMMLLAGAILSYGIASMTQARRDQNYQAALAAADAGVDDYLYRVNNDSNYILYSTMANTCTSPATPANPDPANGAMSSFVPIPGGSTSALFRYDFDLSSYCAGGTIKVSSTGKVGTVTRTVSAVIKRKGFLDYLYFTDIEVQDPALYTSNPFAGNPAYRPDLGDDNPSAVCGRHYYDKSADGALAAPRPDDVTNNPGCSTINFGGGDVINGPLHTNDAMLVCGNVTFNGPAYTSWTGSNPGLATNKHWRSNPNCSNNNPQFTGNNRNRCLGAGPSNDACYEPPLAMPPSNSALKAETNPTITSPPGCLFTGPTKITLRSDGKMDVVSPDTNTATANPGCAPGTGLAIPTDGVVYVQNVPSGAASVACSSSNGVRFDGSGNVTSSTTGSPNRVNPVGYPVANDISSYGCTNGDLFVSGTLKGRLTLAAENNVVVTDDVTYASGVTGTDVLGLVANNNVEVYHPVYCTGFGTNGACTGFANLTTATNNLQLYAAILSVTHSFRVQNYQYGSQLGTLTVTGAIAQKYRGIVGIIGSSGFSKNYVYDSRLKYSSPPKFLDPVQSAYQVANYSEQRSAY